MKLEDVNKLKEMIREDKLEEAIKKFLELNPDNNAVTVLSGQLIRNNNNSIRNTVQDSSRIRNRISDNLLKIIDGCTDKEYKKAQDSGLKPDHELSTIKDLKNEIDQLKKEISTLREENLQNGLVLHYSRPEDKEKGSDKNQVISYLGELKPNGKGNNTGRSFDGKSYLRTDKKQLSLSLFSVCIWFKTNEKNGLLFGCSSKDVEASENGDFDRFLYIENGKLWFGCCRQGFAVINSEMELCDGKWHYVVAKLTPNGMFLYIDGKFIGMGAKPHNTNHGTFVSSDNIERYEGNWFIGGCFINDGWMLKQTGHKKYFTGEIASVRLYDRDLSEREIDILYKKGENY